MGRSVWLTWKIHRFEVAAVVALIGLLAASAWIVTNHITGLGLSGACWPRDEDGNYATAVCDDLMNRFYNVTGGEGGVHSDRPGPCRTGRGAHPRCPGRGT